MICLFLFLQNTYQIQWWRKGEGAHTCWVGLTDCVVNLIQYWGVLGLTVNKPKAYSAVAELFLFLSSPQPHAYTHMHYTQA